MIRERRFLAVVFMSMVVAITSASAEPRPIDARWHDFRFEKAADEAILSSTFGANQFSIKFKGASVERDYLDPPRFLIDHKRIQLETGSVAQALRHKPAREILSAYRDYISSDLKLRGWNILPAENESFTSNSGDAYLFWAFEARTAAGGRFWLHYAATLNGANFVALIGFAESDDEKAVVKSYLKTTIVRLERRSASAATAEDIARLRATRRQFDFSGNSRQAFNSETVTAHDANWCRGDEARASCVLLPPSTLIAATTMALSSTTSRGSYMTFVSDGRSQHVILLGRYDPDKSTFLFSDTADPSPLASGNNVAGVAAVRTPGGSWTITKDELEQVLYGIFLAPGDIMNASRNIGIGPFGRWGTTVAEALKSDFFTYFRLKQTSKAVSGPNGGMVLTFKPEVARVNPLVTVKLHVNGTGRITDADLVLKRKFIDNPQLEMGARDYAQSFLFGATAPVDQETDPYLHDEIFYLTDKPMVVGAGVKPKIPLYPTFGYMTFKGKQEYFMQMLSTSRLWLENVIDEGEPALLMSVGTAN
jgi:hypothetical protein